MDSVERVNAAANFALLVPLRDWIVSWGPAPATPESPVASPSAASDVLTLIDVTDVRVVDWWLPAAHIGTILSVTVATMVPPVSIGNAIASAPVAAASASLPLASAVGSGSMPVATTGNNITNAITGAGESVPVPVVRGSVVGISSAAAAATSAVNPVPVPASIARVASDELFVYVLHEPSVGTSAASSLPEVSVLRTVGVQDYVHAQLAFLTACATAATGVSPRDLIGRGVDMETMVTSAADLEVHPCPRVACGSFSTKHEPNHAMASCARWVGRRCLLALLASHPMAPPVASTNTVDEGCWLSARDEMALGHWLTQGARLLLRVLYHVPPFCITASVAARDACAMVILPSGGGDDDDVGPAGDEPIIDLTVWTVGEVAHESAVGPVAVGVGGTDSIGCAAGVNDSVPLAWSDEERLLVRAIVWWQQQWGSYRAHRQRRLQLERLQEEARVALARKQREQWEQLQQQQLHPQQPQQSLAITDGQDAMEQLLMRGLTADDGSSILSFAPADVAFPSPEVLPCVTT